MTTQAKKTQAKTNKRDAATEAAIRAIIEMKAPRKSKVTTLQELGLSDQEISQLIPNSRSGIREMVAKHIAEDVAKGNDELEKALAKSGEERREAVAKVLTSYGISSKAQNNLLNHLTAVNSMFVAAKTVKELLSK